MLAKQIRIVSLGWLDSSSLDFKFWKLIQRALLCLNIANNTRPYFIINWVFFIAIVVVFDWIVLMYIHYRAITISVKYLFLICSDFIIDLLFPIALGPIARCIPDKNPTATDICISIEDGSSALSQLPTFILFAVHWLPNWGATHLPIVPRRLLLHSVLVVFVDFLLWDFLRLTKLLQFKLCSAVRGRVSLGERDFLEDLASRLAILVLFLSAEGWVTPTWAWIRD